MKVPRRHGPGPPGRRDGQNYSRGKGRKKRIEKRKGKRRRKKKRNERKKRKKERKENSAILSSRHFFFWYRWRRLGVREPRRGDDRNGDLSLSPSYQPWGRRRGKRKKKNRRQEEEEGLEERKKEEEEARSTPRPANGKKRFRASFLFWCCIFAAHFQSGAKKRRQLAPRHRR